MRSAAALLVLVACGSSGGAPDQPDASDASDASDPSADAADPAPAPRCGDTTSGAYCGNDKIIHGDPDTLYECPAPDAPPAFATQCPAGCLIEAAGVEDRCEVPASATSYRLPWRPTTMRLTQDCDDSCCADHVGNDKYAYDWANGSGFGVVAARAGTITHFKINSSLGCASSSCSQDANYLVIDHGDGTQSTYFHLKGNTAAAGITCGAP